MSKVSKFYTIKHPVRDAALILGAPVLMIGGVLVLGVLAIGAALTVMFPTKGPDEVSLAQGGEMSTEHALERKLDKILENQSVLAETQRFIIERLDTALQRIETIMDQVDDDFAALKTLADQVVAALNAQSTTITTQNEAIAALQKQLTAAGSLTPDQQAAFTAIQTELTAAVASAAPVAASAATPAGVPTTTAGGGVTPASST